MEKIADYDPKLDFSCIINLFSHTIRKMMSKEKEIAKILLEKKAVTLNVKEPYTYVSGIRSPIYCDNRKMIAFPEERDAIVESFVEVLSNLDFDVIAGTSTAGIPWASFIAQRMEKPLAYIRPEKKEHGVGKQIEGASVKDKKVIVIEDLISTGKSCSNAVQACRDNGAQVEVIVAIFTYQFKVAQERFNKENCKVITLSNFTTLVETAQENNYLSKEEVKVVLEWNKNPSGWGPKHGFPNAEPNK